MRAIIGIVIAITFSGSAGAATPILSGTYLYSWHEFCGSGQSFGNAITTGTLSFDPATKTVSMVGFHATSSNYTLKKQTGSASYSNTATTVTLDSDVYKAFFGGVKNGVAGQVILTQTVKPTDVSCANQAILSRQ